MQIRAQHFFVRFVFDFDVIAATVEPIIKLFDAFLRSDRAEQNFAAVNDLEGAEAAGFHAWTWHDFRRSFASLMAELPIARSTAGPPSEPLSAAEVAV